MSAGSKERTPSLAMLHERRPGGGCCAPAGRAVPQLSSSSQEGCRLLEARGVLQVSCRTQHLPLQQRALLTTRPAAPSCSKFNIDEFEAAANGNGKGVEQHMHGDQGPVRRDPPQVGPLASAGAGAACVPLAPGTLPACTLSGTPSHPLLVDAAYATETLHVWPPTWL